MTLIKRKQQLFASALADFIMALEVSGYSITLGEAWRSPETCALYAQDGRGIKNSNHVNRIAIDLNLWRDEVEASPKDYAKAGEIWKAQSLGEFKFVWGGDFERVDAFHFAIEHDGVQ